MNDPPKKGRDLHPKVQIPASRPQLSNVRYLAAAHGLSHASGTSASS